MSAYRRLGDGRGMRRELSPSLNAHSQGLVGSGNGCRHAYRLGAPNQVPSASVKPSAESSPTHAT